MYDRDRFENDIDVVVASTKTNKKKQHQKNKKNVKIVPEKVNNLDRLYNCAQVLPLKKDLKDGYSSKVETKTRRLHEISQLQPLECFLAAMSTNDTFYSMSVARNETAFLLLKIFVKSCQLEIPGFLVDIVGAFAKNISLHTYLMRAISALLFQKNRAEFNFGILDEYFSSFDCMLYYVDKLGFNVCDFMRYIKDTVMASQIPFLQDRNSCRSLLKNLNRYLTKHMFRKEKIEFLPTYDELMEEPYEEPPKICEIPTPRDFFLLLINGELKKYDELMEQWGLECFNSNGNSSETTSVTAFINNQQILINKSFCSAMRQEIYKLKNKKEDLRLLENVTIDIKERSLNSCSIKTFCINLVKCNLTYERLNTLSKTIKSGTLFCLGTKGDFHSLILAVATHREENTNAVVNAPIIQDYCINIEILKMFDIRNILDNNYIMFESSVFFELYNSAFEALNSFHITPFAMQNYLISFEKEIKCPSYLTERTIYKYRNEYFKPFSFNTKILKTHLNPNQIKSYQNALKNEFCLIQGPPGTGKTKLSVEIVATLAANHKSPIALFTFSNDSLDKLLIQLAKETNNFVRFGNQSKEAALNRFNIKELTKDINPDLKFLFKRTTELYNEKFSYLTNFKKRAGRRQKRISYEKMVFAHKELKVISFKLKSLTIMYDYYKVKDKGIIAMTTTCGAKRNLLFRLLKTSIVVFKEAAEITDSHIVSCLSPFTQHAILVGDHKQLKPISMLGQGNKSLFERMIDNNININILNIQYRMRKEIANLIRPIIYEDLNDSTSVDSYPDIRGMRHNLYLLKHNKNESGDSENNEMANHFEATEICDLAKYLILAQSYKIEDIIILTPHRDQVNNICRRITENETYAKLLNIKICTVDSFQGMEANIVLLSLACDEISDENLICVCLSRAKLGLFITGNIEVLSKKNKVWKYVKSYLTNQNLIGNKFPYNEVTKYRKKKTNTSKT